MPLFLATFFSGKLGLWPPFYLFRIGYRVYRKLPLFFSHIVILKTKLCASTQLSQVDEIPPSLVEPPFWRDFLWLLVGFAMGKLEQIPWMKSPCQGRTWTLSSRWTSGSGLGKGIKNDDHDLMVVILYDCYLRKYYHDQNHYSIIILWLNNDSNDHRFKTGDC